MVVSKQSYVTLAPWLNTDLADRFRSAFIDAGLMTDWHASFQRNSGVEHRVLKLDYQPGKRFGTQYYWFAFEPTGSIRLNISFTWSLVDNFPTGTRNVDYVGDFQGYRVPTGSNVNTDTHRTLSTQLNSTTVTVTRYTSGINPLFSAFFIKGGTSEALFFLMPTSAIPQPWIDLNRNSLPGWISVSLWEESNGSLGSRSQIGFNHIFAYRQSVFLRGAYARNSYQIVNGSGRSATYGGMDSSFDSNGTSISWGPPSISDVIILPVDKARTNLDLSVDQTPVFADLPYSFYLQDRLPVDFGLCWHFTNSTMESQDIFQVTPGVEEWEILSRFNRGNTTYFETGSPMFMARVV